MTTISKFSYPHLWESVRIFSMDSSGVYPEQVGEHTMEIDEVDFSLEEIDRAEKALGQLSKDDHHTISCGYAVSNNPDYPWNLGKDFDGQEAIAAIADRNQDLELASRVIDSLI